MGAQPLVRIVDASLGSESQVRLVVSRVSKPDRLRSAWASSGAIVERVGDRLHATTTVEALARAAGRSLDREEAMTIDRVLRDAVTAWCGQAAALKAGNHELPTDQRPMVMGIVNVTPDSFSDGGALYPDGHPGRAIDKGRELVAAGADVIDIGGESTRPGASDISEEEELRRIMPVVRALASDGTCVSIDTRKPTVAKAALKEGAGIVNDVSGGQSTDLIRLAAEAGAAYVLMHTRGTPETMATLTDYDDVVAEVFEFMVDGVDRCRDVGLPEDRIILDPGIGFAKDALQNLELLRAVHQFRGIGRPVMVGASRKSFLSTITGMEGADLRLEGSLAAAALATADGASFLRVHDVPQTLQAVRTAHAIRTGRLGWATI